MAAQCLSLIHLVFLNTGDDKRTESAQLDLTPSAMACAIPNLGTFRAHSGLKWSVRQILPPLHTVTASNNTEDTAQYSHNTEDTAQYSNNTEDTAQYSNNTEDTEQYSHNTEDTAQYSHNTEDTHSTVTTLKTRRSTVTTLKTHTVQ